MYQGPRTLTLGLLLFAASAAHSAPVTYVYTGLPISIPGNLPFIITGYVTLATPLPLNGTTVVTPVNPGFNNAPTPVSDSFTGNLVVGVGEPNGIFPPNNLSFTTVNGVITAWHVVSQNAEGNTVFTVTLDSEAGDDYNQNTWAPDCQFIPEKCFVVDSPNTTPGSWSVSQATYQISQGTLAWWTARAWQLSAEYDAAEIDVRNLTRGYLAANAIIAEQNAALVQLKLSVYNLNAQVAKCRANAGKC